MFDISKYEIAKDEDEETWTVSDGERSFKVGPDGEPISPDWFVSDADMQHIKKHLTGE